MHSYTATVGLSNLAYIYYIYVIIGCCQQTAVICYKKHANKTKSTRNKMNRIECME